MNDLKALSKLSPETINDIRLNAAIVRNLEPGAPLRRTDRLIELCNQALEQKDEYYFTAFDDLTENNPIGI